MRVLSPALYYRDVFSIDLDALAAAGVDTLLVDIDNTVVPRDTGAIEPQFEAWFAKLLSRGFGVCLVSNNWHEHVKRIAEAFGVQMVPKALKPLPFGFLRGARLLGSRAGRTAVIGDQLFTDILGGNVLGMTTVLVAPLSEIRPAAHAAAASPRAPCSGGQAATALDSP